MLTTVRPLGSNTKERANMHSSITSSSSPPPQSFLSCCFAPTPSRSTRTRRPRRRLLARKYSRRPISCQHTRKRSQIQNNGGSITSSAFFDRRHPIPKQRQQPVSSQDIDALIHALTNWHLTHSCFEKFNWITRSLTHTGNNNGNPFMTPPRSSRGLEEIFAALEDSPATSLPMKTMLLSRTIPNRHYRLPSRTAWDNYESDEVSGSESGSNSFIYLHSKDPKSIHAAAKTDGATNIFTAAMADLNLNLHTHTNLNKHSEDNQSTSSLSNLSSNHYADPDPTDTIRIEHYRSILLSLRDTSFLEYVRRETPSPSLTTTHDDRIRKPTILTREQLASHFARETALSLAENVMLTNNNDRDTKHFPDTSTDPSSSRTINTGRSPLPFRTPYATTTPKPKPITTNPHFGVTQFKRQKKNVSFAEERQA